ncbi:hypothetical protein A8W25_22225 [Streptomyces sp. ERV7]|uniref:hypothetical protein n=1 Tax=Streptomyces sp. ERV7 TaxID=1322334 RepID=UPI0007F36140|nr:hypothetical protein [Streptomyces sp. ERV7]OAR22374.1 hypothetical protein A8W25_22225 [Streptomyces sp. ERV7]
MTQSLPEPLPANADTAPAPAANPVVAASAPAAGDLTVTVGSHFKMIFIVIVGLTVMFWAVHFGLLFTTDPEKPEIKDALETTKIAGFSSLGTILGLLGGAVSGKL